VPVVLVGEEPEVLCCMCGSPTSAGIWVRRDPKTVYFPHVEEPKDDMERAQEVIRRVLGGRIRPDV
jgi:hypothetical protein